MFKGKKDNLNISSWIKEYWYQSLSVTASALGIIGFFFTIFIYFHDLRPILNEEQLYRQNRNLVDYNNELRLGISKNEKELSTLQQQIKKSNEKLISSSEKIMQSREELIKSNKKGYLISTSARIETEYLSAIENNKNIESFNVRERALELLNEVTPQGEHEEAALAEAIQFVEEYIKPDSMYNSLSVYELTENIESLNQEKNNVKK